MITMVYSETISEILFSFCRTVARIIRALKTAFAFLSYGNAFSPILVLSLAFWPNLNHFLKFRVSGFHFLINYNSQQKITESVIAANMLDSRDIRGHSSRF